MASQKKDPNSLVQKLQEFSLPMHLSDVVLQVEGTKFHVHKCILSLWSPVFEKMFQSDFKEKTSTEIPLPGKSADEIKVLLKMIYSNGIEQEVSDQNYHFLLELADEYQMDMIKKFCITFLLQFINNSNSLHIYKLAERYRLGKDVKSKCISHASNRRACSLEQCKDFVDLHPLVKFEICMKRLKRIEIKYRVKDDLSSDGWW